VDDLIREHAFCVAVEEGCECDLKVEVKVIVPLFESSQYAFKKPELADSWPRIVVRLFPLPF